MQNMDTREYPAVALPAKARPCGDAQQAQRAMRHGQALLCGRGEILLQRLLLRGRGGQRKDAGTHGAKIAIFPDKKLFDTTTFSFTDMEQKNVSSGTVSVTLAKGDGTPYGEYTEGDTAPENPENGSCGWTPAGMRR